MKAVTEADELGWDGGWGYEREGGRGEEMGGGAARQGTANQR